MPIGVVERYVACGERRPGDGAHRVADSVRSYRAYRCVLESERLREVMCILSSFYFDNRGLSPPYVASRKQAGQGRLFSLALSSTTTIERWRTRNSITMTLRLHPPNLFCDGLIQADCFARCSFVPHCSHWNVVALAGTCWMC